MQELLPEGAGIAITALVQTRDLCGRALPVYFGPERARPDMTGKTKAPGEELMETTAPTLNKKPATFTVQPLSPALGAEISGVDLRDPIDDALKQKFLDTW